MGSVNTANRSLERSGVWWKLNGWAYIQTLMEMKGEGAGSWLVVKIE